MLKLEKRMHIWVQIKESEVKHYKNKHNLLPDYGYYYPIEKTNKRIAKLHADTCTGF